MQADTAHVYATANDVLQWSDEGQAAVKSPHMHRGSRNPSRAEACITRQHIKLKHRLNRTDLLSSPNLHHLLRVNDSQ